jgi:hypothetical protein
MRRHPGRLRDADDQRPSSGDFDTPSPSLFNASRGSKSSLDQLSLPGRSKKERYHLPLFSSFTDLFSGPFAVRRLGRRCAAEGVLANRCLSEVIADVRASPRDDPPGPSDSRPRREASPSAVARTARRRERSELVPVGAAFSVPFLAGQKGDLPTGPTERTAIQRRALQTVLSSNTVDSFVEPGRE